MIKKNNQNLYGEGSTFKTYETGIYCQGIHVLRFSQKRSVISPDGEILGLFGMSTVLSLTHDSQILCQQHLTPRELEVCYRLCAGMSNSEIGAELLLSKRTIDFYLENIKNKFSANKKSTLIQKPLQMELLNIQNCLNTLA